MAADGARRAAQAAWLAARAAAAERSLDPLRDALPDVLPGVLPPGGPAAAVADRRLARQLARDAERARQARALALQQHAAAVQRRERVLVRSRRAVPRWTVGTTGAAAAVAVLDGGALLVTTVAVTGAARVGVAVRRLWRPPPVPAPPHVDPEPAPPPHPRSAAFPLVRRLEQARGALQALLPLVCPVGRDAAEEAWRAAAEADAALRWQAARLAAAEPHRGPDPLLLGQLEAGVAAQERLVQAVADLVQASADPPGSTRLQDVTDRLHGLAAGLREVRGA